jgi:predicted acyltransferase
VQKAEVFVPENEEKPLSTRLVSIDALRGFDMFWIIGGGTFFASLAEVHSHPVTETIRRQLEHVEWEGFRFEDLIYPLFLFITGVVLAFALTRRGEGGQSRRGLHLHVLKRSAIIILLGLIMNGLLRFDWAQMRWPGVLQRIGLCYFLAAMVVMHTKWRAQAVIVGAVLVLYWLAMILIPVPGYGAGDLTMQGCLSSYVDQQLIPGKLYYGYGDNEGLISTLPATCTVLLGALAGCWLRTDQPGGGRKAAGLAIAGVLSLAAGLIWAQVFPIIKIIWTSSFVLVSGGLSALLLAAFYWVIDVRGHRRWAFFFVVIGMNPITIYFTQRFLDFDQISRFFLEGAAAHAGVLEPLMLPLGVVLAKWLFLWFLYRHRVFFKA